MSNQLSVHFCNILDPSTHAVQCIYERIVAAVAHGQPVADEEQDVDVVVPDGESKNNTDKTEEGDGH